MFAQLPPPYNEGLYRCVSVDFGPKGTLCNAVEPAPHMNCTTTPMETLTDAVRLAFEKAVPSKVSASWGHANGFNIAGWDTRTNEEYVTMVLATIISGAGATPQQDGWHACGPECCFGALTSGDVELLEYSYPIVIHRYSLIEDSGGAGKFRGGSGTAWEVEPLDREMTFITFGEGRRIPAVGAAGAISKMIDAKVGRIEVKRGGKVETIRKNVIENLKPGETVTNLNPGGGGYGNPFERPIDKIVWDVKNGLVSVGGARNDYGVVIKNVKTLDVDMTETNRLRTRRHSGSPAHRRSGLTMRTKYRLGIDAGGTFTDLVLAARSGDIRLYKALSTPGDPTRAIEEGMKLIAEDLGETPAEIVSNSDLCINGTTVGLNALIQHKGGKTGLICTAGHEDSIEIRLGHKEDGYRYDPEYPAAVMLVPRYLRKGVRERVISNGSIKTPLHEDDVRAACRFFIEEGVEAVAISFVWSVLNSSHERRAAEIVREMMPRVALTVGSDLYPQVREYTRTSTAVVNAYLAPILSRYVAAVDEYFRRLGAKYPVRYFQSNGGLGLGQAISERSVYAINSGPASAPQAGLFVAAPFKKKNVITIDMGGTSFDITLTRNGVTNISKNIDMLRYRIGIPMI